MSEKNTEMQAKYNEIEAANKGWTDTAIVAELGKFFNGIEIAAWLSQVNWEEEDQETTVQ